MSAFPRTRAAVKKFESGRVKSAVLLGWLAMSIGGLAVMSRFIAQLESSIPPVSGTPAYTAKQNMDHYFPVNPLGAAMLVETKNSSALMQFTKESTCKMKMTNTTTTITLTCEEPDALGGGCITRNDIEIYLKKELPLKVNVSKLVEDFPDIQTCPHPTSNTADYHSLVQRMESSIKPHFPDCSIAQVLTFWATQPLKQVKELGPLTLEVILPAGEIWELIRDTMLDKTATTGLVAVSVGGCSSDPTASANDGQLSLDLANWIKEQANQAPSHFRARASSQRLMVDAVKQGIKQTMDLSSATLPIALAILAAMIRNVRLIICTILNVLATITSAILLMYPVATGITVSTTSPSLMIAVAVAMSIDYSLFVLSRFRKELQAGQEVEEAVTIALATSGKIVLVSGLTLLLCFMMMLTLPVQLIQTMGLSAGITVFFAVLAALTLTPVLLLSFPSFFRSDRRYGFSSDGCACGCPSRKNNTRTKTASALFGAALLDTGDVDRAAEDARELQFVDDAEQLHTSCWPRFGKLVQRRGWMLVVMLLAVAIPIGVTSLPRFEHSVGLIPMMPTGSDITHTILDLQDAFGIDTLFATTILIVPTNPSYVSNNATRSLWLHEACEALQTIARATDTVTDGSVPPFDATVFNGRMMFDGKCGQGLQGRWSDVGAPYSATTVGMSYKIDPFSNKGQDWIHRLRRAMDDYLAHPLAGHSHIRAMYLTGEGPNQMDVADKTFEHLPTTIGLMMVVVLVVMGVSFRSIVAPLRAIFCLLWMLAVTFGLSVYVFQDGCLDFLNFQQLSGRETGSMLWMSPCIAISVVVGLGLDYDVFFTERVIEERERGHADDKAVIRALGFTANIISAAGLIMMIAFLSLLLSSTPTLNEIGFLLIIGVLIDCFITTKIIIPAGMQLLGKRNFWPRVFHTPV